MFVALHTTAIMIVNLFKSRWRLEAENVLLRIDWLLHCDERQPVFNCGVPIGQGHCKLPCPDLVPQKQKFVPTRKSSAGPW
jgi:hypothetical protein